MSFSFSYISNSHPSLYFRNRDLSHTHNSISPTISNSPFHPLSVSSHLRPSASDSDQMDRPRFVIEAAEAESMAKKSNQSILQLLPSLVQTATALARPPISKFHVGSVGLGSDGRIYFGVNLEFPGLPLHQSVHAEQFLINNAFINGETQIQYIAVSHAPCGHCRQFLQELRGASDIEILITDKGFEKAFKPISGFLPHRFGPHDLLDKSVPLLLESRDHGLIVNDSNKVANMCNGSFDSVLGKLKRSALEAANKSHAPYSGCPSGVAIMDSDGNVYKGSYSESAAHNPSLGPMQAAVIAYVAGGGGGYEKIVAAALVEKEGGIVSQEAVARLFVKSVSPKCEFSVFHCVSSDGNHLN